VPLTALRHSGRTVALDRRRRSGCHAPETDGARAWRWTDGDAELVLDPDDDASWLEVWWIEGWARYWSIGSDALRARGDHG
jgi:hypothetical protein